MSVFEQNCLELVGAFVGLILPEMPPDRLQV